METRFLRRNPPHTASIANYHACRVTSPTCPCGRGTKRELLHPVEGRLSYWMFECHPTSDAGRFGATTRVIQSSCSITRLISQTSPINGIN